MTKAKSPKAQVIYPESIPSITFDAGQLTNAINDVDGGMKAYQAKTDKKLLDIEQLTKAIMFVAVISLVGVVVAVCGLVLDQVHFNNSTYEQRSQYYEEQIKILKDSTPRF